MKRAALAAAALVAAVAVLTFRALPPARVALDTSWTDGSIPGLLHVHTNRSDGRSAPAEIAAAAARAGLKFIVFTDHGDATREPEPPAYQSGVLTMDGVEISTSGGHYVALDLKAAPYPLAGEPRDVVEDVRRFGGFGVAAHPDSPKPELTWTDWEAPVDGFEIVNPDTSWRAHMFAAGWKQRLTLLGALFTYPFRSSETIGALLTDSPALDAQWDALTSRRRVVGLAGVDAHAKLELRSVDAGNNRYSLPIPGYEASFRTLSVHVTPAEPLTGDAAADARSLVRGIRSGRVYTAVDAWASPPSFEFTAENRNGTAAAGDELAAGGPVSLRVRSNAPAPFLATVWRGRDVLTTDRTDRDFTVVDEERAAVYRVEIRAPDRPGRPPWLISNPIYLRPAGPALDPPRHQAPVATLSLYDGRSTAGWTTEADATSLIALETVQMTSAIELRMRYGLSGGSAVGQFSGVAAETAHGVAPYDRVSFTIRGEHPMRISVQVRTEVKDAPPERFQRSIFVESSESESSVSFDDMRPVGFTRASRVAPDDVRAVMFIVDTTNSKPGASGRLWLKDVRLEQSRR